MVVVQFVLFPFLKWILTFPTETSRRCREFGKSSVLSSVFGSSVSVRDAIGVCSNSPMQESQSQCSSCRNSKDPLYPWTVVPLPPFLFHDEFPTCLRFHLFLLICSRPLRDPFESEAIGTFSRQRILFNGRRNHHWHARKVRRGKGGEETSGYRASVLYEEMFMCQKTSIVHRQYRCVQYNVVMI